MTCASHLSKLSPTVNKIWAKSAQPFLRCRSGPLTCARAIDPPYLSQMTMHRQMSAPSTHSPSFSLIGPVAAELFLVQKCTVYLLALISSIWDSAGRAVHCSPCFDSYCQKLYDLPAISHRSDFVEKIPVTLTKHGRMFESFSQKFIDSSIIFWVDIGQKRMLFPNM